MLQGCLQKCARCAAEAAKIPKGTAFPGRTTVKYTDLYGNTRAQGDPEGLKQSQEYPKEFGRAVYQAPLLC